MGLLAVHEYVKDEQDSASGYGPTTGHWSRPPLLQPGRRDNLSDADQRIHRRCPVRKLLLH